MRNKYKWQIFNIYGNDNDTGKIDVVVCNYICSYTDHLAELCADNICHK